MSLTVVYVIFLMNWRGGAPVALPTPENPTTFTTMEECAQMQDFIRKQMRGDLQAVCVPVPKAGDQAGGKG